ncbi:MAG: ATP-binding protein [Bdellovibrionota bacterium]|nr:ATP-binding protein [Bdellovibrionota bacterium]
MSDERILASEVLRDIEKVKKDLEEGLQNDDISDLQERVKNSNMILDELSNYCKEVVNEERVMTMSLNVFLKECFSKWQKKFWSIDITGTSNASIDVECSAIKLNRAFENIILNSLEAEATEIKVHVDKKLISFSDNGEGISQEDIAKIKEIGTTKEKGRGHGLSMVKGYISKLGWTMELKNNKESRGATVIFHLNP